MHHGRAVMVALVITSPPVTTALVRQVTVVPSAASSTAAIRSRVTMADHVPTASASVLPASLDQRVTPSCVTGPRAWYVALCQLLAYMLE